MKANKKHVGNLIIEKGDTRDFSQLEEVTGYLYICSSVTLPILEKHKAYGLETFKKLITF